MTTYVVQAIVQDRTPRGNDAMNSHQIVAYTYQADIYCPTCLIEKMIFKGEASPAARNMVEENVLDQCADAQGIDRYDETTFDSDEFPKVVFADQADDLDCIRCSAPH